MKDPMRKALDELDKAKAEYLGIDDVLEREQFYIEKKREPKQIENGRLD